MHRACLRARGRHEGKDVGLWDTVIKREEFNALFVNQKATMAATPQRADDVPENPFAFLSPSEDDEEEDALNPLSYPITAKDIGTSRISATTPSAIAAGSISQHLTNLPKLSADSVSHLHVITPVTQPAVPKVDTSFVQVGVVLMHKVFGEGTVRSIKDGRLIVVFKGGEKMFQFPQAIEYGFLTRDFRGAK